MGLGEYLDVLQRAGRLSFTLKTLMDALQCSSGHARVVLHRALKKGTLISPARGFYVIVPIEHQAYGCIPAAELVPLLMQHLGAQYYVALLSAGLFYGASHQKPARFQVVSNQRFYHPLVFGDVALDMVYKKDFSHVPTKVFSVRTGMLKVATPELIALDLFQYPDRVGGLNHIATVLAELIESIDVGVFLALAKSHPGPRPIQRFGYILEQIDTYDEAKKHVLIESLAAYVATLRPPYIPLASEMPTHKCSRYEKWKIIVNAQIESDV